MSCTCQARLKREPVCLHTKLHSAKIINTGAFIIDPFGCQPTTIESEDENQDLNDVDSDLRDVIRSVALGRGIFDSYFLPPPSSLLHLHLSVSLSKHVSTPHLPHLPE